MPNAAANYKRVPHKLMAPAPRDYGLIGRSLSSASFLWHMRGISALPPVPGWDASPSQGYPLWYFACTSWHTSLERENVEPSCFSKEKPGHGCVSRRTKELNGPQNILWKFEFKKLYRRSELKTQSIRSFFTWCLYWLNFITSSSKHLNANETPK